MRVFTKEFVNAGFVIKVDKYGTVQEATVTEPSGSTYFKLGNICSKTKVLLSSCMSNSLDMVTQKRLIDLTVKAYEYMGCTLDLDILTREYTEISTEEL